MKHMTDAEFERAMRQFEGADDESGFLELADGLLKNGFEIEGCILLMATWNSGTFRYEAKDFSTPKFREVMNNLRGTFAKLEGTDFRSIDFECFRHEICDIFNALAVLPGIKATGAAKIMHLKNPKTFVMWDSYIRGDNVRRWYEQLPIVKNGFWPIKKYQGGSGYVNFLKDMQVRFGNITFSRSDKSFARAIDEFNFYKVTRPIQKMEQEEEERKKREKRESKK